MIRKITLALGLLAATTTQAQLVQKVTDPVEWVNPLMGTDSKPSLSNGNTYPAIGLPWGMNFWTPQTGTMGNGWQYQYTADRIRGFKQTHQPSPWMNDYGQFSIMPVTGRLRFRQDDRASWFSHKAEVAKPYYYSVYLADADVSTEIAPTERAAQFRFTFPKTDSAFIVVDAFDRGSQVRIDPAARTISGYSSRYSRGTLPNFRNYFVIQFDKPFTLAYGWHDSTLVRDSLLITAHHAGGIVGFRTHKGEVVTARVASSFISEEQARINLQRELGKDDFETTKAKGKRTWNDVLGRLSVEGGSPEQVRTFYSCLYRAVQFPQRLYEYDAAGRIVHYSPYNGKVLPGRMFGGTGFWDTFRALYPFLNLVYPSINKEMQEGLANDYAEGGWLPEWSSPGYANIMIGNNSASVVADAYIKGLRGYNIDSLYAALLKGANNEGPMDAVGRRGAPYYTSIGYVPTDAGINESAARTLEYAYDDWCIAQLAKALKRPQSEIDLYTQRSTNWRHLFDSTIKLMRGKKKDGTFQSPFNPFKWGDAFTEGNSWHYTWSVFHDIEGLKRAMGGNDAFVAMLDSVFTLPPVYDESYYGSVIHEIREMQIMNMGQYAHGNQPIQHMLYLYDWAGQPWKTQYWVRQAMDRLYKPTPDGYCGDEDNGQTSAWYLFSAMGFYPVCPGSTQYAIGTPLFKKMTVTLENGKRLEISSPANSSANYYVESVRRNGKVHPLNWLEHGDLRRGGTIDFQMSAQPNKVRGTQPSAWPYSASRK
ncbi:GH92 family glycosyl hydrolase [Flaviaesturariibacter amylovorans]|uniref:GH92 family glycosyl hydrolase n=1 Tax=Flaviaesturariibacter amylovorans TaxID=1084520 RepID=A0ABP8HHF4_9BACT